MLYGSAYMARGYLAIVLHTHLPFVRHPEYDRPMEERWLHEALSECYLPLLAAFDRLTADGVRFALTMSLTPPLAAMLRDPLLQRRFDDHLARLEALTEHEIVRLEGDGYFQPVALFYRQHFAEVRKTWEAIGHDVVGALARWADTGSIDLITCSATHAYLPGLTPTPDALRAQLRLGKAAFEHLVGREAVGMWLPECAYDPSFDATIQEAGIRYTLLDTHGVERASPRPPFGVHQPIFSPAGTAFFARDVSSSRQVWSREIGYPGNPFYRDFYRDIGYDLPEDQLYGEVGPFGARVMTGLKYHRISGQTDVKEPYQPGIAAHQAKVDGADFIGKRQRQIAELAASMPVPPLVVAPYDSELFGHWWFEGPLFLEGLFRAAHAAYADDQIVLPVTLRDYLAREPEAMVATPAASSWGAGGFGEVWVGPAAARFWRHIHHASRRLPPLVRAHRHADGLRGRALDLAIRELLLLQTSDWPFILKTNTVGEYAEARIRSHTSRLQRLEAIVTAGEIGPDDEAFVHELDQRDNFLAGMDSATLRGAFDP
jgi:1,4-alpha-glucan branching enzyme